MNRAQRRAHRAIWLVLGPLILAAVAWALYDRAEPPPSELPGAEAAR